MPLLKHIFQDQDLEFINICAHNWNYKILSKDKDKAISEFIEYILKKERIKKFVSRLSDESKYAFDFLLDNHGKYPALQYTHQFGKIRIMGPAKRDREKPYLNPESAVEDLWYKGIIGKTFLENSSSLEEFFFIPDEIINILKPLDNNIFRLALAAPPEDYHIVKLANEEILDHICSVLSSLRKNQSILPSTIQKWKIPYKFLIELMLASDLINKDNQPNPINVKSHLEADNGKALLQLYNSWLSSSNINELHLLPDLIFEGEWENNPYKTRENIIGFISKTPKNTWCSISSLVTSIQKHFPDFQRSAGEYDSWYIKDSKTNQYLKGIEKWKEVEGKLIVFFITGPLHWLGITDLGYKDDRTIGSYRLSAGSEKLFKNENPDFPQSEIEKIIVQSDGNIFIPPSYQKSIRYQISRFCIWQEDKKEYWYKITPSSLKNAIGQGLIIDQLLTLLDTYGKNHIPPSLMKALKNWEQNGTQIVVGEKTILEAANPDIIDIIQKSSSNRYIDSVINPTMISIKQNGKRPIQKELIENGYLIEI